MNENMLVALLQTHTDFGYHVQVLRFSYSQNFLNYLSFKYFDFATLSVPDEGYSRNASCALILIETFLIPHIFFLSNVALSLLISSL
jgi:hypothetical protein